MFALSGPPPGELEIAGIAYKLVHVFKHDFYAATCLYQAEAGSEGDYRKFEKIVVKFGRTRGFCGLGMAWFGRLMRGHEQAIYAALDGVDGVPRWVGTFGEAGYAIEYIDAEPLDHFDSPPVGFFDRLVEVFNAIHDRGVAYCDANKRSNILVSPDGKPYVVDFQISFRRRDDLPWPIRSIIAAAVRYVIDRDMYHLYKHKRRICPEQLTEQERDLSQRRSGLHVLHRKLTKPYRAVRRKFLGSQFRKGRLVSPTAELEDHYQPEKETWRLTDSDKLDQSDGD